MTPEQALSLLSQASAQLSANREVHIQLIKAVEVLEQAIKEKK